jgi:hypothetical protein
MLIPTFGVTRHSAFLRASVASLIMLAGASAAAAEIDSDLRVVVRTYDGADVVGNQLAPAVATATRILAASGIELTWHNCEVAFVRTAAHPCAAPLGANEIAVRIVPLETDSGYRGELPLGSSLVDTRTRSGSLATIYIDRVRWLSQAAGVDASLVLGRALAHEVGHLLLGTNAHSPSGLMRAVWSCESLRRNIRGDWLFAPGDSRAVRQAVRLRAIPMLARLRVGE